MGLTSAANVAFGQIGVERENWISHLQAERKADRTLEGYAESVRQLEVFLVDRGMPTAVENIRREHVEAFLRDLADRGRSASTQAFRYRALRVFFRWLASEEIIPESPFRNMNPPSVSEQPVPVLSDEEFARLLDETRGRDFAARRDRALMLLYYDSGARLSEIANLQLDDVKFEERGGTATVRRKGGDLQRLRFGATVKAALTAYFRERRNHKAAELPWLWVGKFGRLEARGVVQMFKRRANDAGLEHFHVHQLRHTFAHNWLANGGQEGDLMHLMNWRSRTMLGRYTRYAAEERAKAAHRVLSPADRLRP